MALKIYTKTGDKGQTSLFGGKRLSKSDVRIEAYGTVDELNTSVGFLSELVEVDDIKFILVKIQNKLFNMGSQLAVDPEKEFDMPSIEVSDVELLESEIDRMDGLMPPLKSFILPSGNQTCAYAHVVRTICRRAERRVVELAKDSEVEEIIIIYLNRLSDYMFTLARFTLFLSDIQEVIWDPKA